ncbi:histidine kinase [Xanthobacter autotrophicus DSM 431]|uniref:sensor histidine kinase n=1 Tax=Xanthobacter nonsaccharivorans TaxID=3119912 RepID=UPI00372910F7
MESETRSCTVRKAALRFGLVFWGGVLIFSSILWGLVGTDPIESALGKVVHYVLCSLITAGISVLLFRLHEWSKVRSLDVSLPLLVLASFLLSLAAAPLWALLGYGVYAVFTWPQPAVFDWKDFSYDMVYGAALFFGWSCLFTTLLFSFEIHERELALAAVREEALAAQMRALRYQVNPHFLFNTLNSVAGLIEEGDGARAGKMVLSLSEFLRTTLSIDPMSDVPLADELALQGGYLAIERERFSDRMALSIDMPDEVRDALVPSLILQPLIENAIKHGVNATTGPVEIALRARREADRLHLVVENDMPLEAPSAAKPPGMGVGLRNVAERLRKRFADESGFSSGPVAPGRFRVSIDLPWRLA